MRGQQGRGRRSAGPCNETGAVVDDLIFGKAGISDRLAHGDMGIGGPRPHEAQGALIHMFGRIDFQRAGHLAAKAVFGHFGAGYDTGFPGLERCKNLFGCVADRGDDAKTGDDDATHRCTPLIAFALLGRAGHGCKMGWVWGDPLFAEGAGVLRAFSCSLDWGTLILWITKVQKAVGELKEFQKGFFALGLIAGLGSAVLFFVYYVGAEYCPLLPCKEVPLAVDGLAVENLDLLGLKVQEDIARSSRAMVWAALGSIVIGVIGAVVLVSTLVASRKAVEASIESNRIALDANERSLRAYVNVSKTEAIYEDGRLRLSITVSNSGATPAKDMVFASCLGVALFPKDHSPSFSPSLASPFRPEGGSKTTLSKGESFVVNEETDPFRMADTFLQVVSNNRKIEQASGEIHEATRLFRSVLKDAPDLSDHFPDMEQRFDLLKQYPDALSAANNNSFGFTYVMFITYRDVFRVRRRTLYKGFITFEQLKNQKAMLDVCPKHNRMT